MWFIETLGQVLSNVCSVGDWSSSLIGCRPANPATALLLWVFMLCFSMSKQGGNWLAGWLSFHHLCMRHSRTGALFTANPGENLQTQRAVAWNEWIMHHESTLGNLKISPRHIFLPLLTTHRSSQQCSLHHPHQP